MQTTRPSELVTNKKKEKLTVRQVLHLWCNRKITKDTKIASYLFTPKEMYLHNELVSFWRDKKTIFIKDFDNIGAFGNGLNAYSVSKFIPNTTIKVYKVKELPTNNLTIKEKVQYLKEQFISEEQRVLERFSYLKEIATNRRRSGSYIDNEKELIKELNTTLLHYRGIFSDAIYNRFIKAPLQHTTFSKIYTGWSSYDVCPRVTFDYSIYDLVNRIKSPLTNEEWEMVEFKVWRNTKTKVITPYYKRNQRVFKEVFSKSFKESLKFYNDSSLKQELEKRCEETNIFWKKKQKEEEFEKEKTLFKEFTIKSIEWKEHTLSNLNRFTHFYPVFRLKTMDEVESSWGVVFPLKEAIKAISIFKNHIKDTVNLHDRISVFRYDKIGIDVFPTLVDNDIVLKEQPFLKVGCHKVPESEVNDFVNRYKLQI